MWQRYTSKATVHNQHYRSDIVNKYSKYITKETSWHCKFNLTWKERCTMYRHQLCHKQKCTNRRERHSGDKFVQSSGMYTHTHTGRRLMTCHTKASCHGNTTSDDEPLDLSPKWHTAQTSTYLHKTITTTWELQPLVVRDCHTASQDHIRLHRRLLDEAIVIHSTKSTVEMTITQSRFNIVKLCKNSQYVDSNTYYTQYKLGPQ